jgi:hypothetical protein
MVVVKWTPVLMRRLNGVETFFLSSSIDMWFPQLLMGLIPI